MQRLSNRSQSDLFFANGTRGLNTPGIPVFAQHTSDIVTGSNWISAGYGTAGYVMPSGSPVNLTSLRVLPSWISNFSTTITELNADTTTANRPNTPTNSGTNNFNMAPTSTIRNIDFDVTTLDKFVSLYVSTDNGATVGGLKLLVTIQNRNDSSTLVAQRTYRNTTGTQAGEISAVGGLIARFQVSGNIRIRVQGGGSLNVGLLHAIFFD
jgi:hypothetical protein